MIKLSVNLPEWVAEYATSFYKVLRRQILATNAEHKVFCPIFVECFDCSCIQVRSQVYANYLCTQRCIEGYFFGVFFLCVILFRGPPNAVLFLIVSSSRNPRHPLNLYNQEAQFQLVPQSDAGGFSGQLSYVQDLREKCAIMC